MPTAILPAVIGGGASIIGSLLSGKPKTQTSTTTPTFSPEMQQLMQQLMGYSESSIANPTASFGGIRAAGLDNINRTYQDAPQSVATQMARRGYGSSGDMGSSMYKVGMSRAGAVSDFEGKIAAMGADRQQQGAGLGAQLLSMGRGSTTTGTTPDTSAQNALMSAGNMGGNISTLMMLQSVLKGGGGGPYKDGGGQTPGDWGW